MGQLLAVCSGKGGAGKSTVSLWIAHYLAKFKRRVLLVDTDAGLRCLDSMLGVSESVIFDLGDVLGGRPAEDAVCSIPGCSGLFFLAAPAKETSVAGNRLTSFTNAVVSHFDYVIFDLPAGIDTPLWASFPAGSKFIIVGGTDKVSINDASRVSEVLENLGFEYKMVINRFDPKPIKKGILPNIDGIIDETCCSLLGIVPFDRCLMQAQTVGDIPTKGGAPSALMRIAARIDGKSVPILKPNKIHIR